MAFGLDTASIHASRGLEEPSHDVLLELLLAVITIGLLLFVYVRGSFHATLIATSRPASQRPLLFREQLRGLIPFILHRVLKVFFLSRFAARGSNLKSCFYLNVAAELFFSTLKVLNIHMILERSLKWSSYEHVFNSSTWVQILPATLLHSVASSICFYYPVHFNRQLSFRDGNVSPYGRTEIFTVFALMLILYFGIMVPCYGIFIRVAASLLPSKSRGSKAPVDTPLSIWNAWSTFPRSDWIQFYKSLAITLGLEIGVSICLFLVVMARYHPMLHNEAAEFFVKYAG